MLSSKFKLRDLGVVHYFLDIEVQSTSMSLMLQQQKYILDILTNKNRIISKKKKEKNGVKQLQGTREKGHMLISNLVATNSSVMS